jgi:hypothetical protein
VRVDTKVNVKVLRSQDFDVHPASHSPRLVTPEGIYADAVTTDHWPLPVVAAIDWNRSSNPSHLEELRYVWDCRFHRPKTRDFRR